MDFHIANARGIGAASKRYSDSIVLVAMVVYSLDTHMT